MTDEKDQKELKAALASVLSTCGKRFPGNPGRLEQLRSSLATASMAVDHLFTETPYNPE